VVPADMAQSGTNTSAILSDTDPSPVEVFNPKGSSAYVLTCEHAGRLIPHQLGDMGLEDRHLERHIAWDIGAEGLARRMAKALDAPVVLQRFSRLVIDCNRPFTAHDSIPEISDGTEIYTNQGLSDPQKSARIDELHTPYHNEITAILNARERAKKSTALVSIHSFTPCLEVAPAPRPWDVGFLYNRHEQLSHHVHDVMETEANHLCFTFNEPYRVDDLEDYTIPIHGEKRGIPNMLIEVRNDNIVEEGGQREWAELMSHVLRTAVSRM